jgi:nucleotide-binding universal stress UspA family protein
MAAKRLAMDRILCPFDFSDFSERALARAGRLALHFGARVTALHVIPYGPSPMLVAEAKSGGYITIPEHLFREQRREAEVALARRVDAQRGLGVAIDSRVVEGEPFVQIAEIAHTLPADLVVMGTHGKSGWERFLLGSTTEKVMRRVACPLLAVGKSDEPGSGPSFQRILCAVDLSPASARTLELAQSFAQENLAHITLLHVVEGRLGAPPSGLAGPGAEAAFGTRDMVEFCLQQLQRAGQPAQGFCHVEERVERGSAWREIVRVAQETKADLIVIGAHVNGALGRLFLGSTAAQVVRHASCPVLIARELEAFEKAVTTPGGASHTDSEHRAL